MSGNDNEPVPNVALREFATSHAFVMTLSRNQIACLDIIARNDTNIRFSRFVSASKELGCRGLVQHRYSPNFKGRDNSGGELTDFYRLTRAGWLMHDILVEAGLVQAITERALRRLVA